MYTYLYMKLYIHIYTFGVSRAFIENLLSLTRHGTVVRNTEKKIDGGRVPILNFLPHELYSEKCETS